MSGSFRKFRTKALDKKIPVGYNLKRTGDVGRQPHHQAKGYEKRNPAQNGRQRGTHRLKGPAAS